MSRRNYKSTLKCVLTSFKKWSSSTKSAIKIVRLSQIFFLSAISSLDVLVNMILLSSVVLYCTWLRYTMECGASLSSWTMSIKYHYSLVKMELLGMKVVWHWVGMEHHTRVCSKIVEVGFLFFFWCIGISSKSDIQSKEAKTKQDAS